MQVAIAPNGQIHLSSPSKRAKQNNLYNYSSKVPAKASDCQARDWNTSINKSVMQQHNLGKKQHRRAHQVDANANHASLHD